MPLWSPEDARKLITDNVWYSLKVLKVSVDQEATKNKQPFMPQNRLHAMTDVNEKIAKYAASEREQAFINELLQACEILSPLNGTSSATPPEIKKAQQTLLLLQQDPGSYFKTLLVRHFETMPELKRNLEGFSAGVLALAEKPRASPVSEKKPRFMTAAFARFKTQAPRSGNGVLENRISSKKDTTAEKRKKRP